MVHINDYINLVFIEIPDNLFGLVRLKINYKNLKSHCYLLMLIIHKRKINETIINNITESSS